MNCWMAWSRPTVPGLVSDCDHDGIGHDHQGDAAGDGHDDKQGRRQISVMRQKGKAEKAQSRPAARPGHNRNGDGSPAAEKSPTRPQ